MYHPSFEDFCKKARQGNLIPVYREILADLETPVSAFLKINQGRGAFLLESVEGGEKWARYSFLGTDPAMVIKCRGDGVEVLRNGRVERLSFTADPLEVVKKVMAQYRPVEVDGLPRFSGGAVGYLGYDIVRYLEKIPQLKKRGFDLPDLALMITDTLLIFDNRTQKIKVVTNVHLTHADLKRAYQAAIKKIDGTVKKLQRSRKAVRQNRRTRRSDGPALASNTTPSSFKAMIARAKEYIRAGDVIQVVLSQRFETRVQTDPFTIYRALRLVNPSPYMYYLQLGDLDLVGSSPEVLVRCEEGKIEVRPIAGTRPRGKTEQEDKRLIVDLLSDAKERAEHLMLVDLGRNDVGRIAQIGSVKVDEFMVIEKYSHVMHLVSHVQGRLQPEKDAYDVIRACFPAGTVSGAPKVRAMEIIEELEPTRRGPYAGAVGYFSFSGNVDTCINIRTIIIKDGVAYLQAGAGIVADSDPDREHQETVDKAGAMVAAIKLAERGLE
jgi:anthranilate synthase component I